MTTTNNLTVITDASGITVSPLGIQISDTVTDEQLDQLADLLIGETIRREWLNADLATALIARAVAPGDVAQKLGVPVETVIREVSAASEWRQEDREEGVPLHVHAEVSNLLLKPLGGAKEARMCAKELFKSWRAGEIRYSDLSRTLKRKETEIREALQLKLMDVAATPPSKVKETPTGEAMAGFAPWFVKTVEGVTYIIEAGDPATLRSVDSTALAMFLVDHTTVVDRAKSWEQLAKKIMDEKAQGTP